MKAAALVGLAIGFAATGCRAAGVPNSAPSADAVGVGAPTPLTPGPALTNVPRPAWPVYPSRPLRPANPARYPAAVFDTYHPHWVIEVFGR